MKKNMSVVVAAICCCVAVIGMIAAICLTGGAEEQPFVAPAFDSAAVAGTPTGVDDSWLPIYKEGMDFSAHVCGRVIVKDGSADIYFTNDEGNDVWMKLRITDEAGNILGETGLIKPGEYIKSVKFDVVPAVGTNIKMKIMTYEPTTYYSAGAVSLNTVIGG